MVLSDPSELYPSVYKSCSTIGRDLSFGPGSLLDPVKGGALFLLRLSLSPPLVWSRRVAVNDLDGRPHTLQVTTVRPCRGNETTTILAAQIKVLNGPTA